ncbi:MAG: Gmad2 immunoglobulin-like domain-containing protein [Acidimicrobiia bacterium]
MSYEKKIKDLLGRLVSMAPESPPFPEEMPMAAHERPRSRPNPVLMFVAGAALVAAVMVPVLLLTNDDVPVGAGSSTTTTLSAPTTTTGQPTTTVEPFTTTSAAPEATSSTAAVLSTWSRPVYLAQTPENSFLGNPALVPIWVEVTYPPDMLEPDATFTQVLASVGDAVPEPFFNAIPPETQIMGLTMTASGGEDVWLADMNEAFLDGAGGLLADITMLRQLVYTITQDSVSDSVLFTVGGRPVEAFGTEGIVLTDPVGRDDYLDESALIFLTRPIIEGGDGYVVEGMANTFEASLTVQVIDGGGDVVEEIPIQASCGSGCWGEFSVTIPESVVTPGQSQVELFTYSAKDGSKTDVIIIPVPANGIWAVGLSTDTP